MLEPIAEQMPSPEKETDEKPFDKSYVMRVTANNAKKSVDISLNKTTKRLEDFSPGTEKWREVLDTLSALHQFRSLIDDFESHNVPLFTKGS